jgi:excisionase family DNA binding protein
MENQQLLTVFEAAKSLAVKPVTIRLWAAQRKIGSVKLGRSLRIPLDEISRFVALGYTPAAAIEKLADDALKTSAGDGQ